MGPFQVCLKPDRRNEWRHPAGDRPADAEDGVSGAPAKNTPQHFSVCFPVHVCSDPASSHVLVSLHPRSPCLAQDALRKEVRRTQSVSTILGVRGREHVQGLLRQRTSLFPKFFETSRTFVHGHQVSFHILEMLTLRTTHDAGSGLYSHQRVKW